mgnify:CR=1 FL=1
MNNMRNKILMTLALLITAVGGAWAQDIATPVISGETEFYDEVTVTITCATPEVDIYYTLDGSNPKDDSSSSTEKEYKNAFTLTETTTVRAAAYSGDAWSAIAEVTFTKLTGPKVTWDAATKTGTFEMPAYDVEIAPIYAPVAKWAKDKEVDQLPTAIEGIIAGTTDAIVKAGTVVEGQGTAMYFATTDAEMTAEKAAAAEGWLSTLPTAAGYDDAQTVYVWYYIKGADTPQGETATAENTFNDSEICTTPIEVTLLSNKFDIQFNAANANTIEAGKATVKVGETAAEVKEGKLTGVKMDSKVTITAKDGYKFRKAEGKKTGPAIWDGDLAKLTNESTEEFATATDGMTITGTLTANVKVSIADGATITFDNATINGVNNESYNWAGITCLGDATIILKDGTTNKVKGFFKRYPGIQPGPSGKTLIIKGGTAGTGTLEASSSQWGPGIGGENATCGNIEIQGGVITAKGDNGAAGIGSGHARCGNITISGGTVKATGGSYGAGIGSGNGNGETQICGDIVISGGTIEATGGSEGAGIGSGSGGVCGTVTITSGVTSVKATKGNGAPNSIGRGYSGKCGTVTIGGVVGAISESPYTYEPGN